MLADTPLAYITTLAEAAERPHADFVGFIERSAAGTQNAMFVADASGVLVGQAFGAIHPTEPDRTMVYAVYVTPDYRGQGILEGLVESVAAWSREVGRATLELEVVTTNTRALRAYQRLGFACSGEPVPHPTIPVMSEHVLIRRA